MSSTNSVGKNGQVVNQAGLVIAKEGSPEADNTLKRLLAGRGKNPYENYVFIDGTHANPSNEWVNEMQVHPNGNAVVPGENVVITPSERPIPQAAFITEPEAAPKPQNNRINPGPGVFANSGGSVWGDPHFVGLGGEKFDVQGENGKIYNIFNDLDLQVNAKFGQWNSNATVMREIGIVLGDDQVHLGNGVPKVNGKEMEAGETVRLGFGVLTFDGKNLTLQNPEYEIKFIDEGGYFNLNVKTGKDGVFTDNFMPDGLLGQTANAFKKGNVNTNYKQYEVSDLFSSN